jgi:hypothetical protein
MDPEQLGTLINICGIILPLAAGLITLALISPKKSSPKPKKLVLPPTKVFYDRAMKRSAEIKRNLKREN